ncbi:MAG TPA: ATP-binding protein [Symbiobacteriaceae bacterium]
MREKLPSIQRRLLSAIALVLLTLSLLLTATSGLISSRLSQFNLVDRMQVAIQVAWDAYNEGPNRLAAAMESLARLEPALDLLSAQETAAPLLRTLPDADFALMAGADGLALVHTADEQVWRPAPFPHIATAALRTGVVQHSTELVDADFVSAHMPDALDRLYLPQGCTPDDKNCSSPGLVQVVAVPVHRDEGDLVMMAGILLNNTDHVPRAVSERIPDAFLSVAAGGIRVSTNISTKQLGRITTGGLQSLQLRSTVERRERYYGKVPVGPEEHYVAADPIFNAAGEVIGALSIGLPPSSFAEYTRSTPLFMLLFGIIAVLVCLPIALALARRLARPIIGLERDVSRLTSAARSHDLAHATQLLDPHPVLYSREVQSLHTAFRTLAEALVDQTRKTETYLRQLEEDRAELQAITHELQETKEALENQVDQRTEELRQVVAQLREANKLKNNFLATISHELRTPLNSIIGFSEMLIDELAGPVSARQREYLEHILSSGRHLLELISDLLQLSRIEQGRLRLEFQEVALPALIESTRQRLLPQVTAAGLTLEVSCDESVPPIQADPTRVKEILDNLLSNAIKFTPPGGTIWIRLRRAEDMALIEVEDTGIGMGPEEQAIVFDEFVQAESGYKRRHEGVGLGLPLSKKLAEMHGGRIVLTSQLGVGTLVQVYLPLQRGSDQSCPPAS